MENFNDDLKIYSEEVRDVLSAPPKAIYRWGNTIVFAFCALLFLLLWFIRYPDIVRADVLITTRIPPQKIITKNNGRILQIFVKNGAKVKMNQAIAVLESSANFENILKLKKLTDSISLSNDITFPINAYDFSSLGAVENAFTRFKEDYIAFSQYVSFKPHQIEKRSQTSEISRLTQRLSYISQQLNIASKEIALKQKEYSRFKKIFDKGVISAQELETKEIELLNQERNFENLKVQKSEITSILNDILHNKEQTTVSELKDNVLLRQNVIQSYNELKRAIAEWDINFVFRASIDGNLSYLKYWSENQTVTTGEEVFSIVPNEAKSYIAKLIINQENSGKVVLNQRVIIRLSSYPDREFGVLPAVIDNLSQTPTKEGTLLADAKLSNGLLTSTGERIAFRQEMKGTAEILTHDLSLIQRLFYQLNYAVRK